MSNPSPAARTPSAPPCPPAPGRRRRARAAGCLALTLASMAALAQTPPDAGRILQDTRPGIEPIPAMSAPPIQAPARPQAPVPAAGEDARVQVSHFAFVGHSALPAQALEAAVAAWAGRALSFGDLMQAVEAIEARYRAAGYFLAQAYLPPQKIRDGVIEIGISEGRLGEVRLEGESRIATDVLYGYLDRLPRDEALTLASLERQILLVNELAGGRASLDLQAGGQTGRTDVVLALKTEAAISGRLEANNHGLPATGEKRFGLSLAANSPFHLGERVVFNALTSDDRGLTSYNLRGELPVGDGWRLLAGASRAEYSLGGSFTALQASGTADAKRYGVAYALLRSRAANLRLQLEADDTRLVDRFRAAGLDLDKRSRGLTATLAGDWTDEFLGGGASRIDLALRTGRLVLGATAAAQDAQPAGPGTAGGFAKTTLTLQRQQALNRALSLQLLLHQQLAGKNLDSSEKLSLGGPTSLPGYAGGEAAGDSGTLARLAVRWQVVPELALTAFTNYGRLRLFHAPTATTTTNRKRLSDAGIGAEWQVGGGVSAGAILAWAGRESPNPADNDRPRLWFSLGYAW